MTNVQVIEFGTGDARWYWVGVCGRGELCLMTTDAEKAIEHARKLRAGRSW